MKKEIKFRGKIIETCYDKNIDGWAIGYYIYDAENDSHIIKLKNLNCQFYVDGNTIGEFTGCKDKNGVEVYEGDKLKVAVFEYPVLGDPVISGYDFGVVKWNEKSLSYIVDFNSDHPENCDNEMLCEFNNDCEIIGNIYENSGLLS